MIMIGAFKISNNKQINCLPMVDIMFAIGLR